MKTENNSNARAVWNELFYKRKESLEELVDLLTYGDDGDEARNKEYKTEAYILLEGILDLNAQLRLAENEIILNNVKSEK